VLALDHTGVAPVLIPCVHCGCHAKSAEVKCPTCGEPLRRKDGTLPRPAAAVLLGLIAAGNCERGRAPPPEPTPMTPAYGVAQTVTAPQEPASAVPSAVPAASEAPPKKQRDVRGR
jgi:hypothetical protein